MFPRLLSDFLEKIQRKKASLLHSYKTEYAILELIIELWKWPVWWMWYNNVYAFTKYAISPCTLLLVMIIMRPEMVPGQQTTKLNVQHSDHYLRLTTICSCIIPPLTLFPFYHTDISTHHNNQDVTLAATRQVND